MRTSVTVFAVASALLVSGCRSGDDEIRITSVRLEDTGSKLLAHVGVHNGTAYSLYVYQRPRRILWDEPTKTLTLAMRENECTDTSSTLCLHYAFPQYVEVDGDTNEDVVVELPRTLSKLAASPTGGAAPAFEKLEIATANRVLVEMAWADDPVERTDPGQDPRKAVIAAEREILNGEWRR